MRMNIRLWQESIESEAVFQDYESYCELNGHEYIDLGDYSKVFEGTVECTGLEDVYYKFNVDLPHGYKGRSMSVSDVVEIVWNDRASSFYYCDSFGFKEVEVR